MSKFNPLLSWLDEEISFLGKIFNTFYGKENSHFGLYDYITFGIPYFVENMMDKIINKLVLWVKNTDNLFIYFLKISIVGPLILFPGILINLGLTFIRAAFSTALTVITASFVAIGIGISILMERKIPRQEIHPLQRKYSRWDLWEAEKRFKKLTVEERKRLYHINERITAKSTWSQILTLVGNETQASDLVVLRASDALTFESELRPGTTRLLLVSQMLDQSISMNPDSPPPIAPVDREAEMRNKRRDDLITALNRQLTDDASPPASPRTPK